MDISGAPSGIAPEVPPGELIKRIIQENNSSNSPRLSSAPRVTSENRLGAPFGYPPKVPPETPLQSKVF